MNPCAVCTDMLHAPHDEQIQGTVVDPGRGGGQFGRIQNKDGHRTQQLIFYVTCPP